MTENVVWTDGFYKKVVKHSLVNGGYKYFIVDDDTAIPFYLYDDNVDESIIAMCKAIIADCEKESEE